eukprot:1787255-Amphidinium_carterae.1
MFLEAPLPDVVAPIRAELLPTGSFIDAPMSRSQQSPESIVARLQKRGRSCHAQCESASSEPVAWHVVALPDVFPRAKKSMVKAPAAAAVYKPKEAAKRPAPTGSDGWEWRNETQKVRQQPPAAASTT